MTLKISLLAVLLTAGLAGHGCPPSPQPPDASDASPPPPVLDATPPPPSDAGPATDYNLACAALALAGCTEGQKASCAADMQRGQEGRIADYRPKCLIACKDKACVHACGRAVVCP